MTTPLGNAVEFFREFGLFDVILPFLLVFTVVFAILEKTRILGEENKMPKKTLNAMVAFVIAMATIATSKIVLAINEALPNIVLLIVAIICFLMLVGVFYKEGEFDFADKHKKWTSVFLFIVFLAVLAIFMNSLYTDSGDSWLEVSLAYVFNNFSGTILTSVLFFAIAIGAIWFIVSGGKPIEGDD